MGIRSRKLAHAQYKDQCSMALICESFTGTSCTTGLVNLLRVATGGMVASTMLDADPIPEPGSATLAGIALALRVPGGKAPRLEELHPSVGS